MTWRVAAACAAGTSHGVTGEPCQDSCWAQVDTPDNGVATLSIFVADGAGSAKRGGQGAELAIEAAASFLVKKLAEPEFALSDEFAVECIVAIRERIYGVASQEGLSARDFACTFLGVISSTQGTLVFQIGDGGVVLDIGNGLQVPIVPMVGEYANMTHFVTDEDAVSILVTKSFQRRASKVAAFSDGLQRLALNMADNTAHEPFFTSKFDVLAKASAEQEDQVRLALESFLNSDAINERTDDDKTLALAVLIP